MVATLVAHVAGTVLAQPTSSARVPGILRVKLTADAKRRVSIDLPREHGAGQLGLTSFDALARAAGVRSIRAQRFASEHRGLDDAIGVSRWLTLQLSGGADPRPWLARFRNDENVENVALAYIGVDDAVPNDVLYPSQWGHNNTGQLLSYSTSCFSHCGDPVGTPGFDAGMQLAWEGLQGYGDPNVVIAIIDFRGVATHPDLRLVAGWDFAGDDPDPSPTGTSRSDAHGTSAAGIAAAIANNGIGVAGVAGGCSVMPLKVQTSSDVAEAVVFAADNGAAAASMSFSYSVGTAIPDLEDALEYAYQVGVVLVSGVGNNNRGEFGLPQSHSGVIAAAAAAPCGGRKRSSSDPSEVAGANDPDPNGVTCDNERWWGANWGVNVQDAAEATDLLAPTILPTTDLLGPAGASSDDYRMWFNGSSCASPYVAGVAALIKSAHPTWTAAQIRQLMVDTATDVVNVESGVGWDEHSGYGLVNAAGALGPNPTVVEEISSGLPRAMLRQVHPNPVRSRTTVLLELPRAGAVDLAVYDVRGQRVRTLRSAHLHGGVHTFPWDGTDGRGELVASGVYVVRLISAGGSVARKVAVVR
jgi:serine protease